MVGGVVAQAVALAEGRPGSGEALPLHLPGDDAEGGLHVLLPQDAQNLDRGGPRPVVEGEGNLHPGDRHRRHGRLDLLLGHHLAAQGPLAVDRQAGLAGVPEGADHRGHRRCRDRIAAFDRPLHHVGRLHHLDGGAGQHQRLLRRRHAADQQPGRMQQRIKHLLGDHRQQAAGAGHDGAGLEGRGHRRRLGHLHRARHATDHEGHADQLLGQQDQTHACEPGGDGEHHDGEKRQPRRKPVAAQVARPANQHQGPLVRAMAVSTPSARISSTASAASCTATSSSERSALPGRPST